MYALLSTSQWLLAQADAAKAQELPWTWILVGIGVVLLLIAISIYNGLVNGRVETQNAWAQIDVQLKRRHDLIPNLVETVKGYAKHESGTLEKVIQARNAAVGAQGINNQIAAENQLSGALRQLFALSEAYPDLKANTNFLALQEELKSTENRIGFARQHYNDSVGKYNASLMRFPNNLVAGFTGFGPVGFYEVAPEEAAAVNQAPKVQF
ncbi:MAG: LemA family protein [Planctomycetia bacterium]|nr:LemA family protein [Planctomycetia bacterium]